MFIYYLLLFFLLDFFLLRSFNLSLFMSWLIFDVKTKSIRFKMFRLFFMTLKMLQVSCESFKEVQEKAC